MLLTFKTANFLSFNEEITFSMLAGQPRQLPSHVITCGEGRNRVEVLKTAVIYGANASGKSNLIKSMDFARKIIVNGVKTETTANKYFRLDPANREKPSKFEFEFKIDDKMYAYGFTLHLESKKFKSEWLVELGKTTDKPIFERTVLANGKSECKLYLKLTGKTKTRFEVYQEDLLNTQLFLRELQDKNLESVKAAEDFENVFHWLEDHLVIRILSELDVLNFTAFSHFNQIDIKKYCNLLNIDVTELATKEFPPEKLEWMIKNFNLDSVIEQLKQNENIPDNVILPYFFWLGNEQIHLALSKNKAGEIKITQTIALISSKDKNKLIEFEMQDLSDGTRRMLELIPFFNIAEEYDFTIIFDEIDRSLHPELTRKLIEVFNIVSKGVESQLIVTTHESSLLDTELLRRDEIWFAEKNQAGESNLYSLEEFKPRHDKDLRKAYLLGRFGAIPFISDVKNLGWEKANPQNVASV